MKKLKLLGFKKRFLGLGKDIKKIVATIYVKDGQVVIESELPSFRVLRDKIQKRAETEGFTLWHSREYGERRRKISEPDFLEALESGDLLYGVFDGWDIGARRDQIVDE